MALWSDIAVWRGPVLHHSGTITDHKYVVIHTADGTYEGTIAWQKNPDSGNSSHFIVDFDGKIAQVNDTANRSGAQKAGNPYSIAIENAGNENTPLTTAQIKANAKILAKAHTIHGVPLQLTGNVNTRGLGHHSMGAESGVDWGHSLCPGSIIKGQKPQILAVAIAIVNGVDVAEWTQEDINNTTYTLFKSGQGPLHVNLAQIKSNLATIMVAVGQPFPVDQIAPVLASAVAEALRDDETLPHITDADVEAIANRTVTVFAQHLSNVTTE